LQDSGDHTTFVVSAANAQYRYWDRAASFTIQTSPDGSSGWTNTAPASIQYVGGKVTFASAVTGATPSARVTVGKYYAYATLANITKWTFDGQRTFGDSTSMSATPSQAGSAARTFVPLQLQGSFTVEKFWVPETSEGYVGYIKNGTLLILSGSDFVTGHRYEGYVYNNKFSLNVDNGKLIDAPLEFTLDGTIYLI
jgi:hypothetical protein